MPCRLLRSVTTFQAALDRLYGDFTGAQGAHLSPPETMSTFKFLFNGVKVNNGALQRAAYASQLEEVILLRARDPEGFSPEIWETFDVKNESDPRFSLLAKDIIRVRPSHPSFNAVKAAYLRSEEHNQKCITKRYMRDIALQIARD
jgi:hypothetical protein